MMPSMASPLRNRLGSSLTHRGGSGVTTLQASLHVADWSVAPSRFAPHLSMSTGTSLPGPWHLPGPDSPRPAALSLSLSYVTTTSLSSWRPNCWTHPSAAGRRRCFGVLGHLRSTAHGTESSVRRQGVRRTARSRRAPTSRQAHRVQDESPPAGGCSAGLFRRFPIPPTPDDWVARFNAFHDERLPATTCNRHAPSGPRPAGSVWAA